MIQKRIFASIWQTVLALILLLVFPLTEAMATTHEAKATASKAKATVGEEMVVSATRIKQKSMDVPFFVSVVTRADFEKMGARTLEDALRSIPGLQIGTQGNAFLHIEVRGFRDTKDLAVLIDGVPFHQLNGASDLTLIPLGIVERIEFVKGPSSSIWGRGAVAGVLNIITIPPDTSKLQAKIQAGGGSFGTWEGDARVVAPYDKGYGMLNLGASTSDGFQDRTDRDAYHALAHLSHKFTDDFSLSLQYLYSKVDANRGSIIPLIDGEPAFGVDPEDNFGIKGAKYNGKYHAFSIAPVLELGKGLLLKDVFTLTKYDRFATGGITIIARPRTKGWWESDSSQNSIHNDLNLAWRRDFGKMVNSFLVGSYLEHGEQKQFNPRFSNAPTYGPPDWRNPIRNPNNPPQGIRGATRRSDFDQTIISFYAQDRVEIGSLGIMAGVRFDHFEEELRQSTTNVKASQTDSAWSPRFAVDWRAWRDQDKEVVLFANYAEGFRTQFPRLSTRGGVTMPQLLDPEETKSYEGGIKVTACDGRLFGQVSIFQVEKKGPRSYRTSADDFLFTNARTRVNGLEAELHYRFNQMLSGWAHYAYHDAYHLEFKDSRGHSFDGYRVRMSPRHIAGLGLNFTYGGFNWNLTANYVGDRNLRDNTVGTPQNLPAYTIVNTALSYSFGRYELQFVVNNITDEYYICDDFSSQDAGCAGAPRNFFVWLRANF